MKRIFDLSMIFAGLVIFNVIFLVACTNRAAWPEGLYASPSDQGHFMNVHVTNPHNHNVSFTLKGVEFYDNGWHLIPLHPDHDPAELLINLGIGIDEYNTLSSIARFGTYFHPDYPTTGIFRLTGRWYNQEGDYLETTYSNEFELNFAEIF